MSTRQDQKVDNDDRHGAFPTRRSWASFLWDTFDKPLDERRLLFKVDACILAFAATGYFLKYLDQSNVSNAFVSGMREDLDMTGNQLTTAISLWTVGYVIGQIPSNLLITRISPGLWIPFLELGWGVCTLTTAWVKNFHALYAVRFLVGLFESGFYPGMQFCLGAWYQPQELGKRAVLFHTASALGQMMSGFLQTAAHERLDGTNGLAGWRWLFIIDAIITLPLAVMGFLVFPPLPYQAKPNWLLSQQDIDLANERMARIKRKPAERWSRKKLVRMLSSWKLYAFTLLYILWNNSGNAQTIMAFWFKYSKDPKYTVSQINLYPLPILAIYVVTAWIYAWTDDGFFRSRRWPWIMFACTWYGCVCISLLCLPVYGSTAERHRRWGLYYLTGVSGGLSGLYFAWANEAVGSDTELRSLTVACMNDFAYVVQAIVPNFVWRQVDYPAATRGEIYSAVLSFSVVVWAGVIVLLQRREAARAVTSVEELSPAVPPSEEDDEDSKGLDP